MSKISLIRLTSGCQQASVPFWRLCGGTHILAYSSFQRPLQSLAHGPYLHLQIQQGQDWSFSYCCLSGSLFPACFLHL